MANPYMPSSYYDQSGPIPYTYDNQAGPSSYPYQYGFNGHAYQSYHPQQHPQQQHYFPQNPIPNGKSPQPQNFSHTPEYNYHHPYTAPPPHPHSPSAWQGEPEILSPMPKQLLTSSSHSALTQPSTTPPRASHSPSVPASPADSQTSPMNIPMGSWAIWSRRPSNPKLAPGLVFSSRSRPPDHIVKFALDIRTPPPSPIIVSTPLPAVPAEPTDDEIVKEVEEIKPEIKPVSAPSVSVEEASTATETPSTTLPGSPASSTTSISVSGHTPSKDDDDVSAVAEPVAMPDATPVAPAPLAKSWASLLKSNSSSAAPSATSAQRSRPKIPTSSVVGFSIPADAPPSSANAIPSAKRSELLALLNSDFETSLSSGISYAAASTINTKVSVAQISPRGLINTGNMCFANSVLQLLTYSTPFFRLFHELGRIRTDDIKKATGVTTPLVDATIEFLEDFLPEEKKARLEAEAKKAKASSSSSTLLSGANDSTPSSSSSGSSKGKGKERSSTPYSDEDYLSPFIPTGIYDALKTKKQFDSMRGGQQEDAEEFLGFYLEGLEEELTLLTETLSKAPSGSTKAKKKGSNPKQDSSPAVEETEEDAPPEAEQDGWLEVGKRNRTVVTRTIKSTDSPITRIFGGKFRSSLRVPGQKESAIVEDWRSLQLDIQRDTIHTIQDALSNISAPQTVHLTDPPREGSQQVLLEALPPVLVLHMKRFEYDAAVGGVVKVGKQVAFGPELVVGTDVLSAKGRSALGPSNAKGVKYKLFGAIYHHGISASGGHYTLDVLHPDRYPRAATAKPREGWIRIDDELVSDVRPEDVFGPGEFDDGGVRCAYLLFYRRMK